MSISIANLGVNRMICTHSHSNAFMLLQTLLKILLGSVVRKCFFGRSLQNVKITVVTAQIFNSDHMKIV
jgi:hypothetical protein